MASQIRLPSSQQYTVGWIVALHIEQAAAQAVLDERHEKPEGFMKHPRDTNNYSWGRIKQHNIVIASLGAGRYGTVSAAATAMSMVSSLPHLRFGLMVGIGAGVPRLDEGIDIRLGDVVVSVPGGKSSGVVKYDLGKRRTDGRFERVGCLDSPPDVLLKGVDSLRAKHEMEISRVPEVLKEMVQRYPRMAQPQRGGNSSYVYPGAEHDQLYETPTRCPDNVSARNATSDPDPGGLNPGTLREIKRKERAAEPEIHYGVIASGDSVMKDGISRDEILQRLEDKCICFEMEAAGLMNNFPCLVIRGICDYADEFKNDRWQRYAAATAAAAAKELLEVMDGEDVERTLPIEQTIKER
ncbi:hypothetical protein BK809_0002751 [Diplodia seriata]|uniref:Nucleoside phosphorylase domain-containing protein n=1 Tax=Diplodia seriata TaxID=420778 RepID=A0A1S8B2Z5_9PEZI|nr:hypothetical protein BK809_0002751 [Diplodia seriata]